MINIGLLLSRAAGFLLAFTFGIQKIRWYVTAFHAGKPLPSIGLAPTIAKIGFLIETSSPAGLPFGYELRPLSVER